MTPKFSRNGKTVEMTSTTRDGTTTTRTFRVSGGYIVDERGQTLCYGFSTHGEVVGAHGIVCGQDLVKVVKHVWDCARRAKRAA